MIWLKQLYQGRDPLDNFRLGIGKGNLYFIDICFCGQTNPTYLFHNLYLSFRLFFREAHRLHLYYEGKGVKRY